MAENQYMQPFFDTLSQGVQVAQSLRQAAMQQQENDRQNQLAQSQQALREQEFNAQQQQSLGQMLQNGAKPVDAGGNVPTPQPTMSSAPAPLTADSNMNITGGGRQFSIDPTGGGMADMPADPGQTVMAGGRQVQMPSWSDQLRRTAQAKEASTDASRVPITQQGSDMIGGMFPAGTLVDPAHMPGLAGIARTAQSGKDSGGKVIQDSHLVNDDKGNQTMVTQYTDGTFNEKPLKTKGKSDKYGNQEADAANAGAKALTENGRMTSGNQMMNEYHRYEGDEAALRQQLDRVDFALKSGGRYNVKIDDKGVATLQKQKPEDDGSYDNSITEDLQNQRKAIESRTQQAMANKIDAGQRYWDLMGIKAKWGNGAQPAGGVPAAPAPPGAAPTATPAATPKQLAPAKSAKKASMANVQAYASKKGITPTQAQQEFTSAGYQIQ